MSPALTFILLLLALFLLSKVVVKDLGMLVLRLTRSKRLTIGALAFTFLPGTIIHELAHASMAQILRVRTGDIDVMPKVEEKNILLGSVQIEKCDPFRNFLIGIAPLVVGFIVIIIASAIFQKLNLSGFWPTAILFYVLFQIGNTMFSSKRDMEGAIELLIALTIVLGLLYIIGVKQIFEWALSFSHTVEPFFKLTSSLLFKIVVIDLVVIGAAKLLNFQPKQQIS